MKTSHIDVKFKIWDAQVTVKDYGDKLEVSIPCTKTDELGGDCLSFYTEVVTEEHIMALIRKMAEQNKFHVCSKDERCIFNIISIIAGIPFAYGWKVEDFDI